MKSDVIQIDNLGGGFAQALEEARKAALIGELNEKETIRLQILTEEMLSLARSVTGEMKAQFWIEKTDRQYVLHMSTQTVMNKEKRMLLLSAASSRENEAARGFLGKLRNALELALMAETQEEVEDISNDLWNDLPYGYVENGEWDGYERSILKRLADNVKIGIHGKTVDVSVSKTFS